MEVSRTRKRWDRRAEAGCTPRLFPTGNHICEALTPTKMKRTRSSGLTGMREVEESEEGRSGLGSREAVGTRICEDMSSKDQYKRKRALTRMPRCCRTWLRSRPPPTQVGTHIRTSSCREPEEGCTSWAGIRICGFSQSIEVTEEERKSSLARGRVLDSARRRAICRGTLAVASGGILHALRSDATGSRALTPQSTSVYG